MTLARLGFSDRMATALASLQDPSLDAARVLRAEREHYWLACDGGSLTAAVSGRMRHEADSGGLPVVGDWVAIRRDAAAERAVIQAVLPRRGVLVREQAGPTSEPQVLAAHVDSVLIVSSLNQDWNPRRVERALAMIRQAGVQPVLLLTKLDLCADPSAQLAVAHQSARGVPVHALSVLGGAGLDVLDDYFAPGRTVALIGSSGVGKSTLANYLLGEARNAVSPIRAGDDRGRHTTTRRELFELPRGGLLIDTPGLRELGLWDAHEGLEATFEDVEQLARSCRFGDCGHAHEPGCAVQAALADETLDAARWAAYRKLQREQAHQSRRNDERLQHEQRLLVRKRQRAYEQVQRWNAKRR